MLQSERLRYIQQQANQYISRSNVRDSSEQTRIVQARSSGNEIPSIVAANMTASKLTANTAISNLSTNVTISGKGTNMEYLNVLQAAEKCAICADPDPVINPGVAIPVVCIDRTKPPFAQRDLSGAYIPDCKPGFNQYFVPSSSIRRERLPYDS